MKEIDPAVVAELRAAVQGVVLTPEDVGFGAARAAAIWNGDITRQPAAIVRARTTSDVAAAVRVARAHDVDFTVRGGGHGFAGNAVADGAVLLDLSRMNDVRIDERARVARVGGGATWADVDAATSGHSLGVTGGFISHTGVAGLTLGGGFGWLTRRFGMTCDNLVRAEVVTATGSVVQASATDNADLHWALRGGGGNFGIVTQFELALHDLSPLAHLGMFFWRPERALGPLQLARTYLHDVPRDVAGLIGGMTAPPAPFVPEGYHGVTGFTVLVATFGGLDEHESIVAPLRRLEPDWELVTPMPYVDLQQMQDETAPWGALGYEKALYLDDLSDSVLALLIEWLGRKTAPLSFVPIFPLGGAYADVPDGATAFGGSRRSRWIVNIAAVATEPESFAADRRWVRDFWEALRPHAADSGGYINFLADDDEARVRATYGAKYHRLAAVKAAWDPDNVFRHNANIRPSVAPVPEQRPDPTAATAGGVIG